MASYHPFGEVATIIPHDLKAQENGPLYPGSRVGRVAVLTSVPIHDQHLVLGNRVTGATPGAGIHVRLMREFFAIQRHVLLEGQPLVA